MSNSDYHADSAIGSTNLKLGLISPLTLKNHALFKMEETPSMRLGSAVHERLARTIDKDTILEYTVNSRGLGTKTIDVKESEKASCMVNNVSAMFGVLLQGSYVERSFFADYGGIKIKCRPDYLKNDTVYDLKTIQSLTTRTVEYAIKDYGYDISAAFYILVLELLGVKINHFCLIFVESCQPHLTRIFEFSPKRMDDAKRKCLAILDTHNLHLSGLPYNVVPEII